MRTPELTYDDLLLKIARLKSELDNLRRLIFGQKRERFIPIETNEKLSFIHAASTPSKPKTEQITYTRQKASVKKSLTGVANFQVIYHERRFLSSPSWK